MVERVKNNVRIVREIIRQLGTEDLVARVADEQAQREVEESFALRVEPDFAVRMVGPEYLPGDLVGHGAEGFRRAWEDWLTPFESFRIEIEETIEAGDRVVTLVRLTGRTKTGGVEMTNDAAAIW